MCIIKVYFMQLTNFTDYGLRTLMYLADKPERIASVREVSEYFDISRNHLVKVVHRLSQLGYIESSKGKGGGIRLSHAPKDIRVGDVVKQLEPNMELVECFNRDTNTCRISTTCTLKKPLVEARKRFVAHLNEYTLADTVVKGQFDIS